MMRTETVQWQRGLWCIWAILTLVALLSLVRGQLSEGNTSADSFSHYTDHLRHEGEALVLVERGGALFKEPYGKLVMEVGPPCPQHIGLFPERTAPYAPLGVLLFWPWAVAERSQFIESLTVHRLVVWEWTLVGIFASLSTLLLIRKQGIAAIAWGFSAAIPLSLGMGINGFFDVSLVAVGALVSWAFIRRRLGWAWFLLALAAALHFRAAVLAPMAVLVAVEAVRRSPRISKREWAGAIMALLGVIPLVGPMLWAGLAVSQTLETIPAHNPVHLSHVRLPLILFIFFGILAMVAFGRARFLTTAASVGIACVLGMLERSHGFWHASVLLGPGLILAAEIGALGEKRLPQKVSWAWTVMFLWTWISAALAYRHLSSPFWHWLGGLYWGLS